MDGVKNQLRKPPSPGFIASLAVVIVLAGGFGAYMYLLEASAVRGLWLLPTKAPGTPSWAMDLKSSQMRRLIPDLERARESVFQGGEERSGAGPLAGAGSSPGPARTSEFGPLKVIAVHPARGHVPQKAVLIHKDIPAVLLQFEVYSDGRVHVVSVHPGWKKEVLGARSPAKDGALTSWERR